MILKERGRDREEKSEKGGEKREKKVAETWCSFIIRQRIPVLSSRHFPRRFQTVSRDRSFSLACLFHISLCHISGSSSFICGCLMLSLSKLLFGRCISYFYPCVRFIR